jgi:ABC-2 type transport system permease protein
MANFLKPFIRASGFISKELFEIMRQTRLILSLVLGPFLIMLLFGLGYRNEARPLRTLFVVSEGNPFARQIEQYATTLGEQLVYEGLTTDRAAAMTALQRGQIDLVVEVPDNAEQKIRNSEQAVFNLYHNEIDPYQVSYVQYFGDAYIDEVNRRILVSVAEQGKEDAASIQENLQGARQSVTAMRQALERGDQAAAEAEEQNMVREVNALQLVVGGSLSMLAGVDQTVTGEIAPEDAAILETLSQLEDNSATAQGSTNVDERVNSLNEMETDLTELETQLADFQSVSSDVLVAPFGSNTLSVQSIQLSPTDFFVPAVVALLLQHLAVTFAALSLVRERRSGTTELFRISPLSSGEVLFGKYLSYMFFGVLIAAVITITIVFILGAPMLGHWINYILILLVLIFTSLGIGFLISLSSTTETQAVQFSMFFLLGAVFFSGFILDLRYLWQPVRVVSWTLPATYGIQLLQNVMLRGLGMNMLLFWGLLGIGVFLMLLSWFLLHRQMRPV